MIRAPRDLLVLRGDFTPEELDHLRAALDRMPLEVLVIGEGVDVVTFDDTTPAWWDVPHDVRTRDLCTSELDDGNPLGGTYPCERTRHDVDPADVETWHRRGFARWS